ncbi:MAG: crotonase/enoyl-CoA hydratase family protein [Geminicoccaceae bacterium]|nr:crotonase/enoyl-CoA hydratase family protein [Geminicoccaceae bacterium]
MTQKVLYTQDGHVVTLTLNMPETRNAVTDQDVADLVVGYCKQIQDDVNVRAVIVTGAGKAFSSGGNLKHMRDREGSFAGDALAVRDGYRRGIQSLALALYRLEVPTIAAVNGPAFGAGCDTAFACDIRIASEDAVFAENFVRVGLISGDGGSWLLPRAIGLSRACEMSFTGEPVDARTALEWGLVSRVTPPADLLAEATRLAQRIASNPPRALRLAKRLIREGQTTRFDTLLEMAAAFQGICHQTRDHQEAVAAILERRTPNFTGS